MNQSEQSTEQIPPPSPATEPKPATGPLMSRPVTVPARNSVLDRLRVLTRLAGLSYLALSIVARLPVAMLPLSTLIVVVTWTEQLLLGGYSAGIMALAVAVSVPFYSVLAQKLGQRPVLLFCAVTNVVAVLWLINRAEAMRGSDGSLAQLLVASALTGASCAPVAALARVRWARESQRIADRTLLSSSLAFESVADVGAIVLGAAVTGFSALAWNPDTALYMVVVINVLSVTAFAFVRLRPLTAPEAQPRTLEEEREMARTRQRLLWLPVTGMGMLGLLLGSMQSSLVSFTLNFDSVATVGLLYAILGMSALAAATVVNLLPVNTHTWGAWLLWAGILTLIGLPASMANDVSTMAFTLVAEGAAVGIAMIVTDSVATAVAPGPMLDVVLTATLATLLAGNALGLAWGAVIGDSLGYDAALMLPLLAAICYFVLAHVYGYSWRRRFEDQRPTGRHARLD